jgi:hypothetical protein
MATNSNKYTKQTPLAGASTKVVLAERVYIAPADTIYADPTARLDGADPGSPWEDLGIVGNSRVNLTYTKDIRYVETGIERVRRGAYSLGKTAEVQFTLEQYDLVQMELITGLSKQSVGSAGSPPVALGSKLHIGQDDIVERALLFVGTNKVDGKEHHMYCKRGTISFDVGQEEDFRVINVTSSLYPFVAEDETEEGFFTWYVLEVPAA